MKARLLRLLVAFSMMTACDKDEDDQYPVLVLNSNSTVIVSLSWSKVPSAQSYKIWRAFNDLGSGTSQGWTVIATVDANTLSFEDKQLPIANSVNYYVTAANGNVEMKSNEINTSGRTVLSILPYQMVVVPGRHRAVIRATNEIIVVDYEQGTIFRRLAFPANLGNFALAKRGNSWELYVPCYDGNLYICDPADPVILETLEIGTPATSVAVNSKGWIAVSTSDYNEPLKIYRRELLTKINGITDFETLNAHLFFRSDYSLFSASTYISPGVLSLYTLNDQAGKISRTDDPYDWQYEITGELVDISYNYAVTSHSGLLFSLQDFSYQTSLTSGGSNHMDFEFSDDDNTIYAAVSNERNIIKSVIVNGKVSSTEKIPTVGYPWLLSRNGDEMVVLSAPLAFSPWALTGQVIVETVSLK